MVRIQSPMIAWKYTHLSLRRIGVIQYVFLQRRIRPVLQADVCFQVVGPDNRFGHFRPSGAQVSSHEIRYEAVRTTLK